MVRTAAELLIAPLLIAAATLAARRWGARIGGLVSAFPAVVGSMLLIVAQERGAAFAARAATGTLLGLLALSGFALAYARLATYAGWAPSLLAGWLCAALLGAIVGVLGQGLGIAGAAGVAIISLAAAYRAMPRPAGRRPVHPPAPSTAREVLMRMTVTATLVAALAVAAELVGPLVGGMLAALPALASVLAAFTQRNQGADAVVALLRGMLVGMVAFVGFCLLVAVLVVPAGVVVAFAAAAVSAAALQALVLDRRIRLCNPLSLSSAPRVFALGKDERSQTAHAGP